MTTKHSTRSFSPSEAAQRIGVRLFRLRELQKIGDGPESCGSGNSIRYHIDALKQWTLNTFGVIPARLDV
jgi:hypothetical protein